MNLTEAIEVQQHLINSYSNGKKINLGPLSDYMNAQYQKYVESCSIAITLMTAEKQKENPNALQNNVVSTVIDNRIYEKRLREAEESGDKAQIRKVAALKSVADIHNMSFTELCNIINELAALQEGGDE